MWEKKYTESQKIPWMLQNCQVLYDLQASKLHPAAHKSDYFMKKFFYDRLSNSRHFRIFVIFECVQIESNVKM